MAFRIGQKVVCVEELGPNNGETFPVVGHIYTVRAFDESDPNGTAYIFLVEIRNRRCSYFHNGFGEASFDTECFRPVIERRTDISIFTQMLHGNKSPVKV